MKTMTRTLIFGALLSISSMAFAKTQRAEEKTYHTRGTIVSQNLAEREVTVAVKQERKSENMGFTAAPDAKVKLGMKKTSLNELKPGEKVRLSYTKSGEERKAEKLKARPLREKG